MTEVAALHALVDRCRGRRLLVHGDLVLDRFVTGIPKRISREAPVIILRFGEQRDVLGGAANALANVAALGGIACAAAVVGDDEPGRTLLRLFGDRGIDTGGIVVVPGFKTPTKVRILAGGPGALRHQVARYDIEDTLDDHTPWHEGVYGALERMAPGIDAAAISDYGYGTVTAEGVKRLRATLPAGTPLIADSRFALTDLAGVDGATPNLEELGEIAGGPLTSNEQVASAAETLLHRLGARFVLATRGSQGMTLVERGVPPLHLAVFGSDQVADVTGAGDTVIATLTLALAAGASPAQAATLANLAGGVVVMKAGTAVSTAEELHRAIDVAYGDA